MSKIQELALLYFTDCLRNNPSKKASLFLNNRISSEEIINRFKLGYASEKNKSLYNFLLKKGYQVNYVL